MNEGEFAARLGLLGIPTAAETIMLERDLRLVALTGGRYHAASITCAESLEVLARAKDAGLPRHARPPRSITSRSTRTTSAPTAPSSSCRRRCAPRTTARRWSQALADGLIDVVMSDHDPQDVETKRLPFAEAAPGAIGLETMLAAGLRLVHNGELTLHAAARAPCRPGRPSCSACPAARSRTARRPTSS